MNHAQALTFIANHRAAATPDIQTVLNPASKYYYSNEVHNLAVSAGIDLSILLALPQKQVKRAAQMLGAIAHNSIKEFDYTHARILIAMRIAGQYNLTRDAIVALAANIIKPDINTRGITRAQINTLFSSRHNASTVETKVSNSTGKNGIYQIMGITYGKPGTVNREFTLNRENTILKAFFNIIDKASESQLKEMTEK